MTKHEQNHVEMELTQAKMIGQFIKHVKLVSKITLHVREN